MNVNFYRTGLGDGDALQPLMAGNTLLGYRDAVAALGQNGVVHYPCAVSRPRATIGHPSTMGSIGNRLRSCK
jgi:hypothetical protein